jgi:16S rRNA (guanine966-N2)-methyltransferase
LMDPPYANPDIGKLIGLLGNSKLMGAQTTLVVNHSSRLPLQPEYAPLKLVKEHRHGDSSIAIYKKESFS